MSAGTLRANQIEGLQRQFGVGLRAIQPDSVYDLQLVLPNYPLLTLRLVLGPQFPLQAPWAEVRENVTHPLVDTQTGQVVHPTLVRWNQQSSLAGTTSEIVQSFVREPPRILSLQQRPEALSFPSPAQPYTASSAAAPSPASSSFSTTSGPGSGGKPASQGSGLPPSIGTPPPLPTSFSEVQALSLGEVESILRSEEEFDYFFESLQPVKALRSLRDQHRDHNEQIAKDNLSKEKELRELVNEVTQLQNQLTERRRALEALKQRQEEISQRHTSYLPLRLKEAADRAEAESEALYTDFLDERIAAQDFVQFFLAKRRLYHLRLAKHEAMKK